MTKAKYYHPANNPEGIQPPCAGTDLAVWFSDEDSGLGHARRGWRRELVNRTCAACPLREPCLEWALRHEDYGIWAGTSREDRRRIRRERGISFENIDNQLINAITSGRVVRDE